MARRTLSLVAACSIAASGNSARVLIGDVLSESEMLRGSQSHSQEHGSRSLSGNADILSSMLSKEHFFSEKDECLNEVINGTAVYGPCNIRRFPYCTGDTPNICFNRVNRQDAFWPDKHPRYYIDYDRIKCYPDRMHNVDFTCSSCSPGRWCMPEQRCILDENMYHCWANGPTDGNTPPGQEE